MAGIYATLGQSPAIVVALGESIVKSVGTNLFFALLALLVVIPIFLIDKRLGRNEIAVGLGILAVYLMAWLRIGSWEERTHLFEYGFGGCACARSASRAQRKWSSCSRACRY